MYFTNGQVVLTEPDIGLSYYDRRELINEADIIVSDGVEYDLTDRNAIYSIAIPEYTNSHSNQHAQELGMTGYIEYVLRMHAGLLWNEYRFDLAIPCLAKATQLMLYSTVGWQRKDFYRIVDWNIELGRFKKAKEWKEWIEAYTPDPIFIPQNSFNMTLEECADGDTDLVEVGDLAGMCETCAKYRKRIYSLSGKSWKFPKFPKDFHFQCGLRIDPFWEGISEPSFECKNYVLYSRRPFRDDRSNQEKENYAKRMEAIKKLEYKERDADLNHIIYYWFKPKFPSIFPKSLSAFSRMRNANTARYQELVKTIETSGYRIPESLEEVAQLEESGNQPK